MLEVISAFWSEYGGILLTGTRDTLVMVLISTLFAYLIGLPLGVALTVTQPHGIRPQRDRQPDPRLDRQHRPLRALYHSDGGHHALHQAGGGHQDRRQGRHRAPGGLRRPLHRPHGGNLPGRGRRRRGGGRPVHGRLHLPDHPEGLPAGGQALSCIWAAPFPL